MTPQNSWTIDYKLEYVDGDMLYEGIKWAVPKLDNLKKLMRYCFENQEEVNKKGGQALIDSRDWTWKETAKKAVEALKTLE